MKKRYYCILLFAISMVWLIASNSLYADVYIKQKRHTDAITVMGQKQPALDVIEEVWITSKGFRSDNPQNSMMMLFDQKKIIVIDHDKKNYTEIPLDLMGGETEQIDEVEESMDGDDMQAMMNGMMKMDISVKELADEKRVNGWNCNKYIMTTKTMMGTISQEIWATKELQMDKELYDRFISAIMAANPMMQSVVGKMMQEMKKINGVQVRTISTQKIMNKTITSTTDLLEYKNDKAPANIFDMPSGYRKKKWM